MKLQILVPQYKETEKVIKPLLDSIAIQRNIDFNDIGVIIVNDGTNVLLSHNFLKNYPFAIKYLRSKHAGVSATRNVCLDNATADYVMFCDADDCFFSSIALSIIFAAIDKNKFDAFQSVFLEELHVNNEYYYIRRDAHVFVHGKIYRLQYLKDIGLRWEESLHYHEDGYFNAIALLSCSADKFVKCSEPFYLWCYNKTSVCRADPYFVIKTYDQDIKAQDLVIEKVKNRNKVGVKDLLLTQLYQTYFIVTGTYSTKPELQSYMKTISEMITDFYLKYKDIYLEITDAEKSAKKELVTNAAKQGGYFIDRSDYSLDQWLNDLEAKKKAN